jgi:tetratricopeptide (TPR) repeat protein
MNVLKTMPRFRIKFCLLPMVVAFLLLFSASSVMASPDEDLEFAGDRLFSQMQYEQAAHYYAKLEDPTPSSHLKLGICYLKLNELDRAEFLFSTGHALTNSPLALEAQFYVLSTRLARAFESRDYLFSSVPQLRFAKSVLEELFADAETPPAVLQIVTGQLIDYLEYSKQVASSRARGELATLIINYLQRLPDTDELDRARKLSLTIQYHYANDEIPRIFELAGPLAAKKSLYTDHVVANGLRTVAYALYDYERQNVTLRNIASLAWSPHAIAARHFGIEYLKADPTDQGFADWLGMEVCVNLFAQTGNPAYLIEAVELASPSYEQLQEITALSKTLMGRRSGRELINKDDEWLINNIFSSPHWRQTVSVRKLAKDDLDVLSEMHIAMRETVTLDDAFMQTGAIPYMIGGALVLGQLNRDTFPNWMLHNRPGTQPAVLHHQWLSKHLFGNRFAALHRLFDSYGKGTGYYHRMLGGHDLGWLLRNLKTLANTQIPGLGRVGYRRAVMVWAQHMAQDLFSPKGIPTPVLTKTTYLASKAYAKYFLGLSESKARTYALRTASKTCLTFVKIAKGANVALWGWIAYDAYNTVQDFQADATLRDMWTEVSQAMEYGDLELTIKKVHNAVYSRRVRTRAPADSILMRLTLARLYGMAGKPDLMEVELDRILRDSKNIELAMTPKMEIPDDSDAPAQCKKLDKVSRDIRTVLVNDSTFNAMVSAMGLAQEARVSAAGDDASRMLAVHEAVGIFHRVGDALVNTNKGRDDDVTWSAAVNYYRAARLAASYGHPSLDEIADKALSLLSQLIRYTGPVTRPLLFDVMASWTLEIAPERLKDVGRVDLHQVDNEESLRWYQIAVHAVTLGASLLESSANVQVELVRKISEDIELVILQSDVREASPGMEIVLMNSNVFVVHPSDQYILRVFEIRRIGKNRVIYDSSLHNVSRQRGRASIFECMQSASDLQIRAVLKPAHTYVLTAQELELSDISTSLLTGNLGVCDITIDGALGVQVLARKTIAGSEPVIGLHLGAARGPQRRVLGALPAVFASPGDANIRLEFSSFPDVRSRFRLPSRGRLASPLLYYPLVDFAVGVMDAQSPTSIATFSITDINELSRTRNADGTATLRTIGGDRLFLEIESISTMKIGKENQE